MPTTTTARDTAVDVRLFPVPDAGAAAGRGRNQESARRLLHFVDRRFTFAQRVLGWNLDPETRLGRVLLLRRQAFEAERAGAFRMADLLWVEAHRALKHAAADPDVWRHALEVSAFSPAITPEILRERFIQELFIDLHRALFDSRRAAGGSLDPSDRAFVHCAYVERLVDLTQYDAAKSATILRPMVDAWLTACREAGHLNGAIKICTRLADRFAPDRSYLDELVVCMLRRTMNRLTKPPGSFTARDARYLRVGIRSVERVCERQGPTSLIVAALARLHAMYAVALGNTGACAKAVIAIATALDYCGDDPPFRTTRDELIAAMQAMLAKARDRNAGPDDASSGAQAWQDFEPLTEYQMSERATRIRVLRSAVHAIDLWRTLGLPRPATEWPARAHALVVALAMAAKESQDSTDAIAAAWDAAIARHALVREIPRAPIEAFLAERRLSRRAELQLDTPALRM
jgi:hypothetical protein